MTEQEKQLFQFIESGNAPKLQEFINTNNIENFNFTNDKGITPIYIATQNSYPDIIKILADNGADVNKAIPGGIFPIHVAAHNGNVNVMNMLKEYGADFNNVMENSSTATYGNRTRSC